VAGGATFRDRSEDCAGYGIDDGKALLALLGDEEAGLLGECCGKSGADEK